jgi:riboflavin kinase / FMN adenylyltransferase
MIRLSSAFAMPQELRGGVIALGNFDGFHRGHQAVVAAAIARARAEERPAIVATFDPHPARLFRPQATPFRLTTLAQRERLFAAAGADAMLVIEFDALLAGLSPEGFVADMLVGRFGAAAVTTGEDFTFGKGRAGDTDALAALGERHGLAAITVGPVSDGEGPISSSRIRSALIAGDPAGAARLLTRPFAIEGVVQHGDKLGRTIGYPTANLALGDYQRPRFGIYAARVRLEDGAIHDAVANLGVRPSFDPPKELLEPFLFDYAGDLYGRPIEVALQAFLRPEAKFDTIEALVAQMNRDSAEARRILGH